VNQPDIPADVNHPRNSKANLTRDRINHFGLSEDVFV
jgi:hypothetical protein